MSGKGRNSRRRSFNKPFEGPRAVSGVVAFNHCQQAKSNNGRSAAWPQPCNWDNAESNQPEQALQAAHISHSPASRKIKGTWLARTNWEDGVEGVVCYGAFGASMCLKRWNRSLFEVKMVVVSLLSVFL